MIMMNVFSLVLDHIKLSAFYDVQFSISERIFHNDRSLKTLSRFSCKKCQPPNYVQDDHFVNII